MTEVQLSIVVPIDTASLGDMTAKDIVTTLNSASKFKEENERITLQLKRISHTVNLFGKNLELILEEVSGPLERAKALRDLAAEAKKWKLD